jgi:hypothetical protein
MKGIPRNVPATDPDAASNLRAREVVRRTAITVERRVCSVEVHGSIRLEDATHCPVCGQCLPPTGPSLGPSGMNEGVAETPPPPRKNGNK